MRIATALRKRALLPAVACIAVIAVYQLSYVNGFYPISEGWFSEYAHLIRMGEVPYRDFPLLLAPLYPVLLAALQSLFGEGLFALHIFGVFIGCGICFALYDLAARFTRPWAASVAAVVGTIYYQSGVAFIDYDFTQVFNLFLLLSTAAFVRGLSPAQRYSRTFLFAGGSFASLAFLTKQSNGGVGGLILIAAAGAVLIAKRKQIQDVAIEVGLIVTGAFLPIAFAAAWLASQHALNPAIAQIFLRAAQAKGSTGLVYAWLPRTLGQPNLVRFLIEGLLSIALVCSGSLLLRKVFNARGGNTPTNGHVAPLTAAAWLALVAILAVIGTSYDSSCTVCLWLKNYDVLVVVVAPIVALAAYLVAPFIVGALLKRNNEKAVPALIVTCLSVGLVIGNGTSGGVSQISAYPAVTFLFALLIDTFSASMAGLLLPVMAVVAFCAIFVDMKFSAPYTWWLVSAGPVQTSNCEPSVGVLGGICVPPSEARAIARISADIELHSEPDSRIYVFPDMPIFYLATGRLPYDNMVESWFDFTDRNAALRTARDLRAAPPPIVIVAELPPAVIKAHEQLFNGGRPLPQRQILESISELVKDKRLRLLERISSINGVPVDVYIASTRR